MTDSFPESDVKGKLPSLIKELEGKGEKELREIGGKIHELMNKYPLIPEDDLNSSGEILEKLSLPGRYKADMISSISDAYPNNEELHRSRLKILLENNFYEEAARLIIERPTLIRTVEPESFDFQKIGKDTRRKLAVSMAKMAIFSSELFLSLARSDENSETVSQILGIMLENKQFQEILEIYDKEPKALTNPGNVMFLVTALERLNHKDDLKSLLKEVGIPDPGRLDSFRELASAVYDINDSGLFQEVIDVALRKFPEDFALQEMKARYLLEKGDKDQAYTILRDLFDRGVLDAETKERTISLSYDLKLYNECLQMISKVNENRTERICVIEIKCYLETGRYEEASKSISNSSSRFPESEDIKYLKYRLMRDLQRQNEAYDLAMELVRTGTKVDDVVSYLFQWLYSLGEYREIVDISKKFNIDSQPTQHYVVAAMISLRDYKGALELITGNKDLLFSPLVADAMFYNFRSDESIEPIEKIAPENADVVRLVLRNIRGLQPPDDVYDHMSDYMRSRACCFIIAFPYYNSPAKEIPENIRTLLSGKNNAEILDLLEVVHSIRTSGKPPGSFLDSPRFMFPVTLALISSSMTDTAEDLLLRTDHSDSDPFYNFLRYKVEHQRKNYPSAKKYLSKSIAKLNNMQFIQEAILLSIIMGDAEDLSKYLAIMEENSWIASVDLARIRTEIRSNGRWEMADLVLQIIGNLGIKGTDFSRIRRDYLLSVGDIDGARKSSEEIFRQHDYDREDLKNHMDLLLKSGMESKIEAFLEDIEGDGVLPESYLMHGDIIYSRGDSRGALKMYRKVVELGINLDSNRNYISALIDCDLESEAEPLLQNINDPVLLIKLYHKAHRIPDTMAILRKYRTEADHNEELYRFATDKLWYNRDVRDLLLGIFREKGYLFLGRRISEKLFEEGDSEGALKILRNLYKNYPQNLDLKRSLIDAFVRTGLRDEAISFILDNLQQFGSLPDLMVVIGTLYDLYFQDRDYQAIIDFYHTNPEYINEKIIQYVVRSYIELENFDMAEKIISRYEGTTISVELHGQLMEDLNFKKGFVETIFYVSKLFKAEYKEGKVFDRKEAFYKAGIPIEKLPEVFTFLDSRDFYLDINPEKYETYSRDVIQKACKSIPVESIRQMTMNVIYNNLDRKDPVLARNIYLYIREQLETARKAKYKDTRYLKLLKVALREGMKPEPLHLAYGLKVGISDALDVLAIMNHMDRIESNGI